MAAQTPAGATPGASTHRPLLVGAGIGCGCLSILAALVVVLLIFAGAQKPAPTPLPGPGPQPPGPPVVTPQPPVPQGPPIAPAPGPVPQPGPMPQPSPVPQPGPMPGPGPQPGPMPGPGPQPQPGPQQPAGDLAIQITTMRVDQSGNPTEPTRQYRVGERVYVQVTLRAVPTTLELGHTFAKVGADGRVTPITEPRIERVDPSLVGKSAPFWVDGLPAGDYAFLVFLPGPGGEIRKVAGTAVFSVR